MNFWMSKIRVLISTFEEITFMHIYHEYTLEVDRISKVSLHASKAYIHLQLINNRDIVEDDRIQFFSVVIHGNPLSSSRLWDVG